MCSFRWPAAVRWKRADHQPSGFFTACIQKNLMGSTYGRMDASAGTNIFQFALARFRAAALARSIAPLNRAAVAGLKGSYPELCVP